MAASFPPELFAAIVAEVRSLPDLLHLRATNSTLCTLATPLAFRSVNLSNSDKSIARFKRLTTYSKTLRLIREVVYQYEEADPNEPLRQYTLRGYDGTAFVEALSLLSELPSLEHLVLNFRASDGPFKSDTEGSARDRDFPPEVVLQFLIFRALAENEHGYPSPLKSLVIDKFLPLPHPYLGSPTILRLLSTLSHLAINTTSQCKAFPMTDPQLEWPSSYHLFQKEALSASLVSLQLHHACVRSADSLAPISEVHLPHLAYLSLQRTYFSEQGEVEKFIARHGGTLRELKLFLCPMAMSTNWQIVRGRRPTHFRRWARVWERFDRDLKVLKNIVVSERHNSIGVEDANLGRYIDNCYRCNVVRLEEKETAEDDRVFARFKNAVELRSQ